MAITGMDNELEQLAEQVQLIRGKRGIGITGLIRVFMFLHFLINKIWNLRNEFTFRAMIYVEDVLGTFQEKVSKKTYQEDFT